MYYKGIPRCPTTGCWIWDAVAVGMLNHLCKKREAKIVFNSAHNVDGPDYLIKQCGFNQLDVNHLHETIHTEYPVTTLNRLDAISKWLTAHGKDVQQWVVVDDFKIDTPHLVHVNFDMGITTDHYSRIKSFLEDKR
jgi:hypothetical protein